MPKTNVHDLTPAEWMVMQTIWSRMNDDPEVTVSEILPEIMKSRDWHFSTLKTTMDRLVKKGVLSSRVRGKTCFYKPLLTREKAARKSIGTYLDTVLNGAFGPLVAYLADRKGLTKKEIDELERLLETKQNAMKERKEPKS